MNNDKELRAQLTDAALRRAEEATATAQAASELQAAQEKHTKAAARYRAAVDAFNDIEDRIARGITIGKSRIKP